MKVAGTRKGITALQADIKLPGIPLKIIMEALQQATVAKAEVLDIMDSCIKSPCKTKKECWPVTDSILIEPHQRFKLIGAGGINIKKLYLEIGVQMTLQNENEFILFAPSENAMLEAKEIITKLLAKDRAPSLEFGAIYTARITEIRETGVMVTLHPNIEPILLHNSQLDQRKISHPSAIGLEVDQEIQVKYFGRDPVSGFVRLSRKVLQGPAAQVVRSLDKNRKKSLDNN